MQFPFMQMLQAHGLADADGETRSGGAAAPSTGFEEVFSAIRERLMSQLLAGEAPASAEELAAQLEAELRGDAAQEAPLLFLTPEMAKLLTHGPPADGAGTVNTEVSGASSPDAANPASAAQTGAPSFPPGETESAHAPAAKAAPAGSATAAPGRPATASTAVAAQPGGLTATETAGQGAENAPATVPQAQASAAPKAETPATGGAAALPAANQGDSPGPRFRLPFGLDRAMRLPDGPAAQPPAQGSPSGVSPPTGETAGILVSRLASTAGETGVRVVEDPATGLRWVADGPRVGTATTGSQTINASETGTAPGVKASQETGQPVLAASLLRLAEDNSQETATQRLAQAKTGNPHSRGSSPPVSEPARADALEVRPAQVAQRVSGEPGTDADAVLHGRLARLKVHGQHTTLDVAQPVETEGPAAPPPPSTAVTASGTNPSEHATATRTGAPPPGTESGPARATLESLPGETVKQIRYLVDRGAQTVRVRLIPESLGELRLEIRSAGDELSVRMLAANATVRDALETQVHGLREALAREGIQVHRVEVSTSMSQHTNTGGTPGHHLPGQQGAGQQTPGQQPNEHPSNKQDGQPFAPRYEQPADTPDTATVRPLEAHQRSLNVFV